MLVAVESFDLRIPGCGSLKEKRHVVKGITAAIRQRFQVSVAEVEHHDLWQRTTIAVAVVGPEEHHLRRVLHRIEALVDGWGEVDVIERTQGFWYPED